MLTPVALTISRTVNSPLSFMLIASSSADESAAGLPTLPPLARAFPMPFRMVRDRAREATFDNAPIWEKNGSPGAASIPSSSAMKVAPVRSILASASRTPRTSGASSDRLGTTTVSASEALATTSSRNTREPASADTTSQPCSSRALTAASLSASSLLLAYP